MRRHSPVTELDVGGFRAISAPYKTDAERRTGPDVMQSRRAAITPSSEVPDMCLTSTVKIHDPGCRQSPVLTTEIGKFSNSEVILWPIGGVSVSPDRGGKFGSPDPSLVSSSGCARVSHRTLSLSHQHATPSDHQLGQIATEGVQRTQVMLVKLPKSLRIQPPCLLEHTLSLHKV